MAVLRVALALVVLSVVGYSCASDVSLGQSTPDIAKGGVVFLCVCVGFLAGYLSPQKLPSAVKFAHVLMLLLSTIGFPVYLYLFVGNSIANALVIGFPIGAIGGALLFGLPLLEGSRLAGRRTIIWGLLLCAAGYLVIMWLLWGNPVGASILAAFFCIAIFCIFLAPYALAFRVGQESAKGPHFELKRQE